MAKTAIVTGASRGIGRSIAKRLAADGFAVVVNYAGSSDQAQEVVNEIRKAGGEASANYDSVSEFKSAGKIVQCALDTFGRIDCVVNNAGILRDVMFHRMSEPEFDDVIAVHLKGSFNVSRAAAPHFKAQGSGCYVHMTSTSGLIGNFGQANYSAAKMGIVALSKSIALDMQKFGVRSNAVAPFAWTRMIDSIPSETPGWAMPRIDEVRIPGSA